VDENLKIINWISFTMIDSVVALFLSYQDPVAPNHGSKNNYVQLGRVRESILLRDKTQLMGLSAKI
jgi:hypothetical protein